MTTKGSRRRKKSCLSKNVDLFFSGIKTKHNHSSCEQKKYYENWELEKTWSGTQQPQCVVHRLIFSFLMFVAMQSAVLELPVNIYRKTTKKKVQLQLSMLIFTASRQQHKVLHLEAGTKSKANREINNNNICCLSEKKKSRAEKNVVDE